MEALEGQALVYGSKNKVVAWHKGMERPVELAERHSDDRKEGHRTMVTFLDDMLYDVGYGEGIYETLDKKKIKDTDKIKEVVFGMTKYRDTILTLSQFTPPSSRPISFLARLSDLKGNQINLEIIPKPSEEGELSFREGSLSMAVAQNNIYLASENVVELKSGGLFPKLERITDYLSDFVDLVSNGEQVFSIAYHSREDHPDGTEVRTVPGNKRVTYWPTNKDIEESIGCFRMGTMIGNTLIIGTNNLNTHQKNLYAIDITQRMLDSKNGVKARPKLLLENAFERDYVYGRGNPMTSMPLEKLLEKLVKKI